MDELFVILQVPVSDQWGWLFMQPPIIVLLGLIAWYQYKDTKQLKKEHKQMIKDIIDKHEKACLETCDAHKEELKKRDDRINDLADKALSVASLYDVKSDMISREHEKILNNQDRDHEILINVQNNTKN